MRSQETYCPIARLRHIELDEGNTRRGQARLLCLEVSVVSTCIGDGAGNNN